MQLDGATQLTAFNMSLELWFGLRTARHRAPAQLSTRLCPGVALLRNGTSTVPTAVQTWGLMHEVASSSSLSDHI